MSEYQQIAYYHIRKRFGTNVYAVPFLNIPKSGLPITFWQNSVGTATDVTRHRSITIYYLWQSEG